jgi:lysozyme family protein
MSDHFKEAYDHILKWEGGGKFHKVEGDAGGATKWGVSLRGYKQFDKYAVEEDIEELTYEDAAAFARKYYWDAALCKGLKSPIALVVFDHAYNRGPKPAIRLLQGLCDEHRDKSLYDVNKHLSVPMLRKMSVIRMEQYNGIVNRNFALKKFLLGWTNRVMDTEKVSISWLNNGII